MYYEALIVQTDPPIVNDLIWYNNNTREILQLVHSYKPVN